MSDQTVPLKKLFYLICLIDSFQLKEHTFINRGLILPEKGSSGYLEKIFVGKISFYRLSTK